MDRCNRRLEIKWRKIEIFFLIEAHHRITFFSSSSLDFKHFGGQTSDRRIQFIFFTQEKKLRLPTSHYLTFISIILIRISFLTSRLYSPAQSNMCEHFLNKDPAAQKGTRHSRQSLLPFFTSLYI